MVPTSGGRFIGVRYETEPDIDLKTGFGWKNEDTTPQLIAWVSRKGLGTDSTLEIALSKEDGTSPVVISLKTDGTIWSWGSNSVGQMGINASVGYNFSSPRQIGALTTWTQVKAGYNRAFGIRSDGTLWAWGSNTDGQLGDGTRTNRASPVQVGALTNWSSVAGGQGPVVAVKTDGTLWSWGNGTYGALGLGNTTYYSSPKQVGSLTNWSKVSARWNTCFAIKTDGTLWAWGQNQSGQLGIGNRINYSSPMQIGALTTWLTIAAGSYFALAIKTDGTLWLWGDNSYGKFGNNTIISVSSPIQTISGGANWRSAEISLGITTAIREDCW
jgi:alpha-tubulin suppressor-like RCC1 family protein